MDLKYQLMQTAALHKGQVRGRYAPSPSGAQHLGNIQTAIVAWLQARLAEGKFLLRMDDIDTPRVKAGSSEQILNDLRWLGLDWDEIRGINYRANAYKVYVQSEQIAHYHTSFDTLLANNCLFPCTCSRRQIRRQIKTPNAAGQYIYPGTCRENTIDNISRQAEFAWRYRVKNEVVTFTDRLMGKQAQDVAKQMGDFIVKRRNNLYAYQLVSVVDDIEMGITDVVRGADLLDSTPVQILLTHALGASPVSYWHVPLKMDSNCKKLAKRDGAQSLMQLRQAGQSAEQIIGQLSFELGLVETKAPLSLVQLRSSLSVP